MPGGIGSGIHYGVGSLQALQSADLQTTMLVHPEGLNASQAIDDLFTTATNRTDKTIELVGWYYGTNSAGDTFFAADSVLVQLHRTDAVSGPGCWQSTFDVAGAKRNNGERFTSTAP